MPKLLCAYISLAALLLFNAAVAAHEALRSNHPGPGKCPAPKLTTLGAFAVGDVGALASRNSSGAFVIRHDRVAPFALDQLAFTFEAQIGRDVVFSGPPPLPLDAIAALPKTLAQRLALYEPARHGGEWPITMILR